MLKETNNSVNNVQIKNIFYTSVISGAVAGTICDFVTFPLDTLKTRLQSQHGFFKSGGFKQLYKGLAPVMIGSAPSGSLFFIFYEGIKIGFEPRIPEQYHTFIHMTAASVGEMVACLIRVPVEVVKQRRQAFLRDTQRLPLRTLYRGYGSTVVRDLPFAFIQMPLWEYFKLCWKRHVERECTPLEGAISGSASVAISATITTPLDVAKTRIMLSSTTVGSDQTRISIMLNTVYRESGFKGLFAGYVPRISGFTISGFIFFGVYEKIKEICISILPS
ncbi:mitochondrial S-adenosylmethionine carrier protein [Xylocopa sonorina]|uniref:mitochondrial S-adenosylmethionine carrier protein n=1 Tax=Xylocopa sonorina TaxID=1818115 RepID=UPI00403B0E8F